MSAGHEDSSDGKAIEEAVDDYLKPQTEEERENCINQIKEIIDIYRDDTKKEDEQTALA